MERGKRDAGAQPQVALPIAGEARRDRARATLAGLRAAREAGELDGDTPTLMLDGEDEAQLAFAALKERRS
jgi:hypothetical protein